MLFQFFKKIFNDSIYLIVCNQYSITTQPNPQGILNRTNLSLIYMYPSILPQKFQHFWLKVFETFLTDFSFFFIYLSDSPPPPFRKSSYELLGMLMFPDRKSFSSCYSTMIIKFCQWPNFTTLLIILKAHIRP